MALALAAFIAYVQVGLNDFINFDDNVYVTENYHVKNGLTADAIRWAFTSSYASNWHPLTWISHMTDCQLFGLNPLWHHLTNLFFHIANTLLLFWVFKRMTRQVWLSAFVAAAFAVHPLHVESVAWIAERKDVLSGFFWLLTLAAYVRYVERPGLSKYLLVLLFFGMGLLAKPMLVTLPFVLFLMDYWPLRRFSPRKSQTWHLIREKIPLFVLAAASCAVTYIVQQKTGAMEFGRDIPLISRMVNALVVYILYIAKTIYPCPLSVFYPYSTEIPLWEPLLCLVLLICFSLIIVRMTRRAPYLTVGWLWYLGTLVPVIGLVQIGRQAMADRYMYLPSIGLFVMAAWGGLELFNKWQLRKTIQAAIAVIVLLIMLMLTQKQVNYWQNDLTLFGHALDVTENNYTMQTNYGNALQERGRLHEAVEHFKEALRINPNDYRAYNNLGLAYLDLGKIDEGIEQFDKILNLDPNFAPAHYNLAVELAKLRKYNEAITQYLYALSLNPDWPDIHNNLAAIYYEQGKRELAVQECLEAVRLDTNFLAARLNLARTLFELGRIQQAVDNYYLILQKWPDNVEALTKLAWILAITEDNKIHNPDDAVKFALRACDLAKYKQPEVLDVLAAAYAAAGKFSQAQQSAQKAVELAASAGKNDLAEQIKNRLQLYKAGQSYSEK